MPRTKSPSFDDDDPELSPAEVLTLNNERSRINPTLDASQHWSSSEATPSETLHQHLMHSSCTAPNAHPSYSSSSQLSFDPSAQDTEVLYSEDSPNVWVRRMLIILQMLTSSWMFLWMFQRCWHRQLRSEGRRRRESARLRVALHRLAHASHSVRHAVTATDVQSRLRPTAHRRRTKVPSTTAQTRDGGIELRISICCVIECS